MQYTSLKVLLEELFPIVEERGLLCPLPPMSKLVNMRNKSRFYKFKNDHGHSTSQYCDLKYQVEDLVGNRYLDEFIDRGHSAMDRQHIGDDQISMMDHEWPIVRVIAEGLTMAGDSNRAKKNYSIYASASWEVLFNMLVVKKGKD